MKVLVVGATGVVGRALIPVLVGRDHEVYGTSRSSERAAALEGPGVIGRVLDIYDTDALRLLLAELRPDAVMYQVTDLPDDPSEIEVHLANNARIRREAIPAALLVAQDSGVKRQIAQSVAWDLPGEGGEAVRTLEAATLAVAGVVASYGQIYGPGTYLESAPDEGRAVSLPNLARQTADLLDAPSGVVIVVDPE